MELKKIQHSSVLYLLYSAVFSLFYLTFVAKTEPDSVYTYLFTPRGPQMFTCLTYLERNVRVDCEFLASDMVPGPYCEYRQDSRLVGSTYPNAVIYVSTEDRRRSNVSLVAPNLCRLTWAPLADEKPYTYTCRVYQVLIYQVKGTISVIIFLFLVFLFMLLSYSEFSLVNCLRTVFVFLLLAT
uniref:Si:ch211-215c18.3 n=1 Tax=Poecilia latipinna TaxID=48699 RepID=A0A3B3UI75_9TELE